MKKSGRTVPFFRQIKFLACFGALLGASQTHASDIRLPERVWTGEEVAPQGRLPDGEVSLFTTEDNDMVAAWYGSPTRRYQHGILGDDIEAGSLHVETRSGQRYDLNLPENQVFEDRTPRLVDLNDDGNVEIVTIRSFKTSGASIAIYGVKNDRLVELASTAPIGRPNRWLNIAGIRDYAGRGDPQIAYVETPHIGGTLRFVEWQGDKLVPIASFSGFSNHKIGSRDQLLSGDINYNDDTLPDLAAPSNDRRTLIIVGFHDGTPEILQKVALPSPVKSRTAAQSGTKENCLVMTLENRDTFKLCR